MTSKFIPPKRNPRPQALNRPVVKPRVQVSVDQGDPYPVDGTFYHPQAISDALSALDPATIQGWHVLNLLQGIFDAGFMQGRYEPKVAQPHFKVTFDNQTVKNQMNGTTTTDARTDDKP